MPTNLEKDGFIMTTTTPESIERIIFSKIEKNRLFTRVIEGYSFDFSFLMSTNTKKDGPMMTINILKPIEGKVFTGLVGKNEPNIEIDKNSSSDISDLSLKQDILESDLGLKPTLLVKSYINSYIAV